MDFLLGLMFHFLVSRLVQHLTLRLKMHFLRDCQYVRLEHRQGFAVKTVALKVQCKQMARFTHCLFDKNVNVSFDKTIVNLSFLDDILGQIYIHATRKVKQL